MLPPAMTTGSGESLASKAALPSRLRGAGPRPGGGGVSKVPEITAMFWVTKLATTAMGEATADYLAHRINPFVAGGLGAVAFTVALLVQFAVRRYVPWVYWLAVAMVAVFGTMAADGLHIQLGIPYVVSSTLFALGLVVIFVAWYATEKTLSIHSITTWRRETFYWATVMATFALGTAAGDVTAIILHLGYFSSAILFAVLAILPGIAYWRFGLNEVVAFWFAYVMTRPVGASLADWASVSHARGGLAWGYGPVSIGLTAAIVLLVAYLTVRGRKAARAAAA